MDYKEACEILGYRVTNTKARNAELATSRLRSTVLGSPLKYKVACRVLINA